MRGRERLEEVVEYMKRIGLTSSPPRKGEGSLPEGSSFPPSVRVYIPHLVGSRVAQRTTPI